MVARPPSYPVAADGSSIFSLGNKLSQHMTEKYIYGKKATDVESAAGAKGVLIRSGSGFFFRVYKEGGLFDDYEILHDDLSITIDPNELASFYHRDDHYILDHSPSVFGLKKAKNDGHRNQ